MSKRRGVGIQAPTVDKYEIESAARTLVESERIKSNSRLFRAAQKEMKRQAQAALKAAAAAAKTRGRAGKRR